jgi:hypothetical protein
MPDMAELWKETLPLVKQGVTGVGVWTALNACRPVVLEDNVLVLGLPHEDGELAGHLKMPQTARLIEQTASKVAGSSIKVRVIDGLAVEDWEKVKRRDVESARLQEQAMQKARVEHEARASWDGVYEQLGRKYASMLNKSLPQNRAKFLKESIATLADIRKAQGSGDEYGERNFARCIERVAQYGEVPSGWVALQVLERAGEL